MKAFARISFLAVLSSTILSSAAFGQSNEATPAFDLADVHASPKGGNPYMSGGLLRGARYDVKNATMLDLIQSAYSLDDSSKIVGGPIWLNTDRFDIAAKAKPATSPEALKLMLQSLLADRFKLVVHKDTKPLPVFVLSMGKGKPKMKEADGSSEPGCKGVPQDAQSGPIPYILVSCHGMTMAALAGELHDLAPGYVTSPAVDQTNLQGSWDLDLKWSGRGQLAVGSDTISFFDAIDKQLGLKLEAQRVSLPVIVVDSVNQKPAENPPGVTTNLPAPPPAEFEVASIRPSQPGAQQMGKIQNDRLDLQNFPLKNLINIAWNINSDEMLANAPKFLDTARFDLVAKAPTSQIDFDDLRLMLRALLVDRFKLATHMETRTVSAYTLTSVKPKLQKADPSNRTECKDGPGADGKDPRNTNPILGRLVTCRNMSMAQLVEQFQNFASGYIQNSVVDATAIEGAYDFTLSFSGAGALRNSGGRGGDAGPGAAGASDPNGAISLFEAVNKQLGLKLELQKRPMPVLVIDHVEEKPTDN